MVAAKTPDSAPLAGSAPMAEADPFIDKAGALRPVNRLDKTGEN